jgi:hypothetical protein
MKIKVAGWGIPKKILDKESGKNITNTLLKNLIVCY